MTGTLRLLLCLLLLFLPDASPGRAALPQLMLAESDDGSGDVSGWLMSEKLDGVRGLWDGTRLLSKNGLPFSPPAAFIENFPDFAIEGEIWGGRGSFARTVSIVRKQADGDDWLTLRFAVFDAPGVQGPFTARLEAVRRWFAVHPSRFAFVIDHAPAGSREALTQELRRIEEQGGEGLILRRPDAPYTPGRSRDVLKVKRFVDAEARVVAHLPGRGRNEGRLGSLLVELPANGLRFRIGSGFSDAEREDPPPIGTLVTFRHNGFHDSGLPRFPVFLRVRPEEF
ncbi:MAG: DNA ligase [Thermodesulfobacteriota bacterium]